MCSFCAVMNPMDLDSMWMGGRQPQAAAQSADGTPTSPTQTPSRKAASTGGACYCTYTLPSLSTSTVNLDSWCMRWIHPEGAQDT
jgi:hypothetical protein